MAELASLALSDPLNTIPFYVREEGGIERFHKVVPEVASRHQLQVTKHQQLRNRQSASLTKLTGQFQEDGDAPSVP